MVYGDMPSRKLTFTLPQDLAAEFLRQVPASLRSKYVATANADKLRECEAQLVRACQAANNSTDVREIENSFALWRMKPTACRNDGRPWRGEIWWVRLDPTK